MSVDENKVVVLTGAGVSAESGLQTFRDSGGLWGRYTISEVPTTRTLPADARCAAARS